jgi:prepilin-type N-terminal cleavage/methylation domain-containing protein/prepilin-type processing-associated H-X9-DG protein
MRRKGFTLIELLVVIAIIAILAAILFPVFAKARQRAKQATCSSNCNQIVKAVLMYGDDNDDKFPRGMDHEDYLNYQELSNAVPPIPLLWGGNPAKDNTPVNRWRTMDGPVGNYLKSKDGWQCPADKGQTGMGTSVVKKWNSSYTWPANLAFKAGPNGTMIYKPYSITQVKFPTRKFVICDSLPLYSNFSKTTEPAGTWHRDKDHRSYTMAFVDGHVQVISEQEFMNPPDLKGTWAAGQYMWTYYYVTG